jgi:hypothetical protein
MVVVVVEAVVVVVGSSVVVVGSSVVVVGSTVLSGAGWGSVVVVVGAVVVGGPGELGGGPATGAGGGTRGAGVRLVGETGATWAGGSGVPVPLVDDVAGRVLEAATEGSGPVVDGSPVVSVGRAPTPVEAGGEVGARAAEVTIAASTAKVSPNATSMSRTDSRCSARWRGVRVRIVCCRMVRLWPGLLILRIDRSNGKSGVGHHGSRTGTRRRDGGR